MLREVLQAIESADGAVHIGELSQRLGIERSALEGMIDYWVHKGRLQLRDSDESDGSSTSGHCGPSCTGTATCHFVARMPKTFSVQLTLPQSDEIR